MWLNGVPASHTGICQTLSPAGLPKRRLLAGLGVTAWKPLAYPGHSWGSCPLGCLTFNWKEVQPRATAKADTCKRKSGRACLWERWGAQALNGPLTGPGEEELGGFNFETWQADLQAKDHQYFCLKLKKKWFLASCGRGGGFSGISDKTTPLILSTEEGTRTPALTSVTHCDDSKMSRRQLGLIKWVYKDGEPDTIKEN